jgi:hypothetical protein
MVADTLWTTGTIELGNFGDEILLLDPYFTAMDVATYEGGTYPGVHRHPGVATNESIERLLNNDTNDCSLDFRRQSAPTPGEPFSTSTDAPLSAGGSMQLSLSPNPTSSATTIRFHLPSDLSAKLAVFDLNGRLVRTLAEGALPAGPQTILWDGLNSWSAPVASRTYFIRLISANETSSQRITLLR